MMVIYSYSSLLPVSRRLDIEVFDQVGLSLTISAGTVYSLEIGDTKLDCGDALNDLRLLVRIGLN